MRALQYLYFTVLIGWLIHQQEQPGVKNQDIVGKGKIETTSIHSFSTGYSYSDAEIVISPVVVSTVHPTVDKKEPLHPMDLPAEQRLHQQHLTKASTVSALVVINAFDLLFPFHHFW